AIANGQPGAVDFGTVQQGQPGPARSFDVFNDGDGELDLGQVSLPAGFVLIAGLDATVAPGSSGTFAVRMDTAAAGTHAGTVGFATNVVGQPQFSFGVTGQVTLPPGASGPDVAVS